MTESCERGLGFACLLERQTIYLKILPGYFLIDYFPYGLKSALFLDSVFEFHLLFLESA